VTDRDPDDTTPSSPSSPSSPSTPPPYGQDPHGSPYPPQGYGQPYYPQGQHVPGQGPTIHPQANTALVLGIVSLAGGMLCGLPLLAGPFAWYTGRKVKREIEAAPQHYTGGSEAGAGMVLGIVSTVLLALGLLAGVLLVGLLVIGASA
jgi:hypothetical protein